MSTLFPRGSSANLRIIIFILLSLGMMALDHRQGYLDRLRTTLSIVIYPVQYIVNIPTAVIDWCVESISSRAQLNEEIRRLYHNQFLLNIKLQKFESLEVENERLREMLQSSRQIEARVLVARLLAVDVQPLRHQVAINKGQYDDIYEGQPIIDANGIMGQIISIGQFSSLALLLTDPAHAIPVQINRNGLRAVAVGTGESHLLHLEHLPNNADINEGDLVVSSGLGDTFPPGYPVGIVNNISRVEGEPFSKITIIPSAQLTKSREVLLVWTKKAHEFISGTKHD